MNHSEFNMIEAPQSKEFTNCRDSSFSRDSTGHNDKELETVQSGVTRNGVESTTRPSKNHGDFFVRLISGTQD